MKNKKIILLIALLAVAVIGLGAVGLRAWLTSQETGTVTFTVGEVKYTLTTPEVSTDEVVPGVELLEDGITLTNGSNVDTEFRFYWVLTESTAGVGGTALVASDIVVVCNSTGFATSALASAGDGLYHTYSSTVAADSTTPIDLVTSITLNGATVGNAKAGASFTITFYIQAKQKDGVAWADMGSIDFETGLAA